MEAKFALRDYAGNPVSHWFVREVEVPKPVIEKTIGHHIVIVDRSGSMYYEMADTKTMVEKVFTVEEFHDANLLLTLISYSSAGDYTVHFSRTPVAEVNAPESAHIASLRSIRATCLTSVSQALVAADEFIGDETTGITVHTDGWFNDKSPAAEKKAIDKWLKVASKRANVMVNCIAYRQSSDFNYLSTIANQMSGACALATNVKEVYTALHDTTALLAGRSLPAIPLAIDEAEWQTATNLSQRKVNGASHDLILRGVGETDEVKVYRFSKVNGDSWTKSKLELADASREGVAALAAFARSKLAEGNINDAKFAVSAMGRPSLFQRHYNALSADRLTAFAQDLNDVATGAATEVTDEVRYYGLGQVAERSPLTTLFALLNEQGDQYSLNLPAFTANYIRRGIKRLNGKFDESGTFVPNAFDLVEAVSLDEDPYVAVTGFDINTAEATINMQTRRDGELQKDGKRVVRVAGVKLDVPLFRAFTVISDGVVGAPVLPILVHGIELFVALKDAGFIEPGLAFGQPATITLGDYPIVPLGQVVALPDVNELTEYAQALVGHKILKTVLPDTAKGAYEWTPEQVEELRAHGLTPVLAFSAPTTNHYTDRDDAASKGLIDSYTRYAVSFGTAAATDLRTSLWSANEYLTRRFEVEGIKKLKFSDLTADTVVRVKELSARTKLTPLDALVMPVFESHIEQRVWTWSVDKIKSSIATLERRITEIQTRLSEVALVLGSTGLIPAEWQGELIEGEKLAERYEGIDIPKAHLGSTFINVKGTLVGVHPDTAWYTTKAGEEAIEKLLA